MRTTTDSLRYYPADSLTAFFNTKLENSVKKCKSKLNLYYLDIREISDRRLTIV